MSPGEAPASDLAGRILQLERRQRRQFGILMLLVAVCLIQVAEHLMPGPGEVLAQRFVLRNPGHRPRAELSLWTDGTPAFRLNDDEGKARALWVLRRDGMLSLRMLDSNYTTRAEMLVQPDGSPRVVLYGEHGHSRVNATVNGEKGSIDYPSW